VHGFGSLASVGHGENNRSTAAHDITTGKERGDIGLHGVFTYDDSAFAANLQSCYRRRDKRVRRNTDSHDDQVNGDSNSLAFNGYRTATAGFIGFAQLHDLQHSLAYTTALIRMVLQRIMQRHELDALFLGMAHFLNTCGHLVLATAIDDGGMFSAETFGCADSIHSGITTSDDDDILAIEQRRVGILAGRIHEVDACQVLVAGENAVEVLAGYVHETRQTGTGADEDGLVAFGLKIIHAEGLTDNRILAELNAHGFEAIYLAIDDGVGQTELRNTIFEYAAYLVESLEDGDAVAVLGHITGESEAGRAGADHGDAWFSIVQRCLWLFSIVLGIVGDEALEVTDSHRFAIHLEVDTLCLALFLLRANTSADSRQAAAETDDFRCTGDIVFLDMLNERGNVDVDRTTLYTTRVGTVEAAVGLGESHLRRETLVYLLMQFGGTIGRGEFGHEATLNCHALLGFDGLAQLESPGGIAAC